MKVLAIIPARLGSTRFPGKPLARLRGRPLIEHVWRAVRQAPSVSRVLVATDAEEIAEAVRGFGGEAVRTAASHETGADRVAEAAAAGGAGFDAVLDVQGDEPLLAPAAIEEAVAALAAEPPAEVATLAFADGDLAAFRDPNVVKVVCDAAGDALLFSRAPIGAPVGGPPPGWRFLRHVGLYAFRPAALARFARLAPGALERAERLEQLRLLEHGTKIRVARTRAPSRGVDTPEDLAALERDWDLYAAPAGTLGAGGARP